MLGPSCVYIYLYVLLSASRRFHRFCRRACFVWQAEMLGKCLILNGDDSDMKRVKPYRLGVSRVGLEG